MDSKKEMYELKKFNKELIDEVFECKKVLMEVSDFLYDYKEDFEDRTTLADMYDRIMAVNLPNK